jgi:hypothetical protein
MADLRREGLRALLVRCIGGDCYRVAVLIEFDALGLPDETPFRQMTKLRVPRCTKIGAGRFVAQNGKQSHDPHRARLQMQMSDLRHSVFRPSAGPNPLPQMRRSLYPASTAA